MTPEQNSSGSQKTISVFEGVIFTVGIVIGIGIFRMPPLVAQLTPNEIVYVLAWIAGGAAMLIGMLCYAELASMHPDAGGEYTFLRRAYGARVAILFVWARGTVIQTGAIAYVAFVFGDYANQILQLGGAGSAVWAGLAVIVFTAVNLSGTQPGKRTQIAFSLVTLAALSAVAIAGLLAPATPQAAPVVSGASHTIGLAMVFVLLTYGGWNEVAYLSGEVKNPRRDMVRIALIGTAVVTAIYVGVSIAYLNALGFAGLRDSKAVGVDLMRLVAGDKGALIIALIVCAAALSTLNATIFTGARAYYALGRDLPFMRVLGIWDKRGSNPANAFLIQGAIALALVIFGSFARDGFAAMVDYTAPVFWFFLLLVSLSLFVFRYRTSERPLAFSVPLYPLTPAIFTLACAYLLYSSLAYTGLGALFGLGVLAAGIPLALFSRIDSIEQDAGATARQ
jgi:APA family basic amino acid/polyamine antiporter